MSSEKLTKPTLHKIVSETPVTSRRRKGVAFKLEWNNELTDKAVCRGIDTEVFYPSHRDITPAEEQLFASMCIECPVMLMCLEWALVHERNGIWGGTTPYRRWQERKRLGWVVSEPDTML